MRRICSDCRYRVELVVQVVSLVGGRYQGVHIVRRRMDGGSMAQITCHVGSWRVFPFSDCKQTQSHFCRCSPS